MELLSTDPTLTPPDAVVVNPALATTTQIVSVKCLSDLYLRELTLLETWRLLRACLIVTSCILPVPTVCAVALVSSFTAEDALPTLPRAAS